jgi:hypothetical protein
MAPSKRFLQHVFEQLREGGRLVAAVGVGTFGPGVSLCQRGWRCGSGRAFFNVSVKSAARFPKGRRVRLLEILHQGKCRRVAIVALLRDGNLGV